MLASVPTVDSASTFGASASVLSGRRNRRRRDLQHTPRHAETRDDTYEVKDPSPAVMSTPSSAQAPSMAQAAFALAAALQDAGPSIPNETLVSEIITAFIRTGPKPKSASTPIRNSTESVTPTMNIEVRLKELETRDDLAIAKFEETLLNIHAEQKRLESLVNEQVNGTKTRLANVKRKIAELAEATCELI